MTVTKVVVGVDGSDSSEAALQWASRQAAARHAELEIVHAWSYPYVGELAGISPAYPPELQQLEAGAQAVLEAAAAEAATSATEPLTVRTKLVRGDATTALLEAAAGAELLVVGSRGRGGFGGLLLGSVSQQCAHHTPCPIAIVPRRARA